MQPQEQLNQLHDMMKTLNKGNATHEEVVKLFGTLGKAIKEVRTNLEKRLDEGEKRVSTGEKTSLASLRDLERRIDATMKKSSSVSDRALKTLRKEILAELDDIRGRIPELPDFETMLQRVEKKIPAMPVLPKEEPYMAGKNIEIEDRVISNTNPKITVSNQRPKNPEINDIWIVL